MHLSELQSEWVFTLYGGVLLMSFSRLKFIAFNLNASKLFAFEIDIFILLSLFEFFYLVKLKRLFSIVQVFSLHMINDGINWSKVTLFKCTYISFMVPSLFSTFSDMLSHLNCYRDRERWFSFHIPRWICEMETNRL